VTIAGSRAFALRDTGSSDTIVDASCVPEYAPVVGQAELSTVTGQKSVVLCVAIEVDTPFFQGTVRAAVVAGSSSSLLIGNRVVFADGTESAVPASVNCCQPIADSSTKREEVDAKNPLRVVKEVNVSDIGLSTDQIKKFQNIDLTLRRYIKGSKAENENCSHGSFFIRSGVLFRCFAPSGNPKQISQLVIPSGLRPAVLHFAHKNTQVKDLGIRRAANLLLKTCYWPGLKTDIRHYRQTA
jgi:hypothetical protein